MTASMTTPTLDDPNAVQLMSALARMDAANETASPDELDAEEAAGVPDEEDAAGPEEEARAENEADVGALMARGKQTLSFSEALALMERARRRGRRATLRAQANKRKRQPSQGRLVLPANMVPPNEGMRRLVAKWQRKGIPFSVRKGHYYDTAYVVFEVEGNTKTKTYARIQPSEIRFFDRPVDDDIVILGKSTKVNFAKTNYTRSSKNDYNEQDFLIQTVNMREAGFRIQYPEAEIANLADLAPIKSALTGGAWIYDDNGHLMPSDIFHDFTERNLLYEAIKESAILRFNWKRANVGGNANENSVIVDKVSNIPNQREMSLVRTSGGADVLHMPDGYVVTDNPNDSEYGSFTATIELTDEVVFPIKSIDLGAGTPVKPAKLLLAVQLNLFGTSVVKVAPR
jgi:hypothetical protein